MSPVSPPAPAWTPPSQFEEFRLVRYLGGGGMGHVWLAHDLLLDRPVAVKFLAAAEPDAAAPDSVARVLAEARAAARLQHPNVAAVYRVGELQRRPYIISEYVRGEGLDRLPKPVEPRRAIELAVGLCRGLGAAHRRGVLHRDLKPGNVIVAEDGEVKLVDFGLAKLLDAATAPLPRIVRAGAANDVERGDTVELRPPPSRDAPVDAVDRRTISVVGSIAGTPYYMAPEIWRGEAATPRSDLYSVGALLFELCAGRTPFAGTPMHELPDAVAARPAPSLLSVVSTLDARLGAVVDKLLQRDAAARFGSTEELLDALLPLAGGGAAAATALPDGNPYRGLMPFEAEHRALFFGRGREIRAVVERLRAERLVVVTGDSGAGKSSLCRAGVVPLIADGTLREGRRWSTATLVPGRRPLRALAAALAPLVDADEEELERLADEPDAFARRLQKPLGRDRGLLVFVDQLEELATLAAADEAARFGAVVRALVDGGAAVRLLAAVRGDFLTRVAAAASLGELLSRALYILTPLDDAATREAIVGPARLTGVGFESEALVETLVRATVGHEGGLPLLQFALAELWEARDRARGLVTVAALQAIGGVEGALARHGDRVLAALLPAERQAARRLLLRLVTLEGTRARRAGAELAGDAATATALEALVRGRLVVARQGDDGASYEVAHEALVTGWTTLRDWLAAEAGGRAARLRLEAASAEWDRLGRAADALWGARQLDETALLRDDELGARERDFVAASRRAVRRRRWRRGALAVSLPLAAAAVVVTAQAVAGKRLAAKIAAQLAKVDAATVQARADSEAASRAAAAASAFDAGKSDDGERRWSEARAAGADADVAWARAAGDLEAALSLDAARADVRARLADALYERALLAESQWRAPLVDELVARLALYDADGSRQRRFFAPGTLALSSTPPARATLVAWTRDHDGQRRAGPPRPLGTTPLSTPLPPGSYVVTLTADGRAPLQYPFVLARGERLSPSLRLPAALPDGFVYVPPGRFLYGTADEAFRSFDTSVPIHTRTTRGFFVAKNETTFAEYLAFLDALPPAERARHTPAMPRNMHGSMRLERLGERDWRLYLQPTVHEYTARLGEPIAYKGRDRRTAQDWRKFPVVGIGWDDVEAYLAWLRATGRVPGARVCTEVERERAARGADEREFPHGDRLAPDDANFDETYGKEPLVFGPDEVGAHPASRSSFGLDDVTGNVWEWTVGEGTTGTQKVLKGGAYYYGAMTARIPNRQVVESSMRDANLGLRVCADPPRDLL